VLPSLLGQFTVPLFVTYASLTHVKLDPGKDPLQDQSCPGASTRARVTRCDEITIRMALGAAPYGGRGPQVPGPRDGATGPI
jgi:hypothetical protein